MNWEDEEMRRARDGEDDTGSFALSIVLIVLVCLGLAVSAGLAYYWINMPVGG